MLKATPSPFLYSLRAGRLFYISSVETELGRCAREDFQEKVLLDLVKRGRLFFEYGRACDAKTLLSRKPFGPKYLIFENDDGKTFVYFKNDEEFLCIFTGERLFAEDAVFSHMEERGLIES